jgi:EmrB/QacA subfamily drug resistance transporter
MMPTVTTTPRRWADERQRWTLVAVVLGSGMVFLDSTVVTVALPRIGQELVSTRLGVLEAQSYVYNGYLLSLSALLVLAGALNDHLGRRRMFGAGLVAFGVTSALCGLAPTMEALVVARVLQGAAGALLVPGALALLTDAFDGEARGRAFGMWAGVSAVATILGPPLGGLLVDLVSWRAVFLMNLPLAVAGVWAVWRHVVESRDEAAGARFDWPGAAVVALAVGGLTFGAIRGQEHAWQDGLAWTSLAVGAVAAAAFVPLMAARADPLVPLDLFRSRNFAVTNASTVAIYGGLYVTLYFLVLFLQGTVGYNASAAGVATLPTVAFLAVFSTRVGTLAARRGPRWFMAGGPLLMAVGVLLLTRIPPTTPAWQLHLEDPASILPPGGYLTDVLPGLVCFGLGIMVVVAPLTTALLNSVPEARSGVASAVNNALSRVGPQLATAILFVAVTATFYGALADRLPGADPADPSIRAAFAPLNPPAPAGAEAERAAREASTEAFGAAMTVAAGLLAAGGLINALGIRNPDAPLAHGGRRSACRARHPRPDRRSRAARRARGQPDPASGTSASDRA